LCTRSLHDALPIYQNAPHDLCRDSEEVSAVLPAHAVCIDQTQVSLIDEGGSLEGTAYVLAAHVTLGQPMKLGIDERHELVARRLIGVAPSLARCANFFPEGVARQCTS